MVLDELANASIYAQNPYYLLGIKTGTTGRKLRRREEDLLEGAALLGGGEWKRMFANYLLGNRVEPGVDEVRELAERLKDPEFAVTSQFFGVWPYDDDQDATEAVLNGEHDKAFRVWRSAASKGGINGGVAKHNMAVLLHYYAIDAETSILNEPTNKQSVDSKQLAVIDQYWKASFALWEEIVDDDGFWDSFTQQVREVDDPRLNEEFVSNFRRQFPIAFDNINADFMARYARMGKLQDAKRHFEYMTQTMSGSDDVDESVAQAFKPMVEKVNLAIKRHRDTKDAKGLLAGVKELLAETKTIISTFKFLLPPDNELYKSLSDNIATTGDALLIKYFNAAHDTEGALAMQRQLLDWAVSPTAKRKIEKGVVELEEILKQEKERDTCWYCKTYQKDMRKLNVKIYGNVRPDPKRYNTRGVTYSYRDVPVPVCSNCTSRFNSQSARDYPPLKAALSAGWKIGSGPTNAEMDAAWLDLASAFNDLFGRR